MLLFLATAKVTASAISGSRFLAANFREGLLMFEMEFLRRVLLGSCDSGDGPESQLRNYVPRISIVKKISNLNRECLGVGQEGGRRMSDRGGRRD
jgi:hypothetical protein